VKQKWDSERIFKPNTPHEYKLTDNPSIVIRKDGYYFYDEQHKDAFGPFKYSGHADAAFIEYKKHSMPLREYDVCVYEDKLEPAELSQPDGMVLWFAYAGIVAAVLIWILLSAIK